MTLLRPTGRLHGAVAVWDPLLRIFHWSLATCFAVTLAFARGDTTAHNAAGYVAVALVAFRIAWGFVGPQHARFSDFVPSPRSLGRYLRDLASFRERRTLGHNPAGAVMILLLLGMTLLLGLTGWMMTTDSFYGVRWVQDLHEGAADIAIGLIGVHVLGVAFETLRHGDNLVLAMITGKKRA